MELKRLMYTRQCGQRMTTCLVFFECARCRSSRTPTPHSDGAKDLMLQHPVVKEVTKIRQMRQNSGAEKLTVIAARGCGYWAERGAAKMQQLVAQQLQISRRQGCDVVWIGGIRFDLATVSSSGLKQSKGGSC